MPGATPAGCFASPSGGRAAAQSRIDRLTGQSADADPSLGRRPVASRRRSIARLGRTRDARDRAAGLRSADRGALTRENPRSETPSLIPTKPPIRVEEGLVEVGWDGDLETEFAEPDDDDERHRGSSGDDSSFNEELIEDRYAALQAWSEWTESQKTTAESGVAIESSPPRRSAEPVADRRRTVG